MEFVLTPVVLTPARVEGRVRAVIFYTVLCGL